MDQGTINHINKNTDLNSAGNYDALREKAIALVQAYAGHAWTDYNLHDPGVTILEHVCYAITDLAYRTGFDIKDLLADEFGKIDAGRNLFYSRKDILSSTPVTVNDLRKLVLDNVPEVYNVWFEKVYSAQNTAYIKGLYRVVIQLFDRYMPNDETASPEDAVRNEAVLQKVRKVVLGNRNLGEDYTSFTILKPSLIEVEADIVIDRHIPAEEILASVYMVLEDTLNPVIQFYSETELAGKGYSREQMYSGPALQHGFLLDAEMDARIRQMDAGSLVRTSRYRVIDPSDLLRSIGTIPGILYVRDFKVKADGAYREAPFELDEDAYPFFSYEKEARDIRIFNEQNEVPLKETLFLSHLHKKQDLAQRKFIKNLHEADTSGVLRGEYRNPGQYFSLQHLFPPVYGLSIRDIGTDTFPKDAATEIRKAGVKQLKAYLLLFEQLLANYLAQLNNLDKLITADVEQGSVTYFSQPLYDVPAVANVLRDFYDEEPEQSAVYWERFMSRPDNGYLSFLRTHGETDEQFHQRKSRVIDHLLSRFNLNLKKYPVLLFTQLYYPEETDNRVTRELQWKSAMLKEVVAIGRNRNQAWDYSADGVSASGGFEELMCRLLYIQYVRQRKLSEVVDKFSSQFHVSQKTFPSAQSRATMTSVPLTWSKGAKMEMLISEEEMKELLSEKDGEQPKSGEGLRFDGQPVSFLRDALDSRQFRIGPDIHGSGYVLLYKAPSHTKWSRAGRFPDWQSAQAAMVSLQATLRDFNIESEGFHLVEHILLRPSVEEAFFGFRFNDEKGHVLLYQNHWMTYQQREELLSKLVALGREESTVTDDEMAELLNYQCLLNHWQNDKLLKSYHAKTLLQAQPELAARLFDRIRRNMRSFNRNRNVLYPGIEHTVRRIYSDDLREDFFHLRMTIVLPAWPARFQDNSFRNFVETLFREYTPAHLKLDVRWLDISAMREFEKSYFDWRESMSATMKTDDDLVKADKLLSFLNNGTYSVS